MSAHHRLPSMVPSEPVGAFVPPPEAATEIPPTTAAPTAAHTHQWPYQGTSLSRSPIGPGRAPTATCAGSVAGGRGVKSTAGLATFGGGGGFGGSGAAGAASTCVCAAWLSRVSALA